MINSSFRNYAHGKLLLSGEYVVLDGAEALAAPTKLGQHFLAEATERRSSHIDWQSLDDKGNPWFEGRFQPDSSKREFVVVKSTDSVVSDRIVDILNAANQLHPELIQYPGIRIGTQLEFPISWGLGSSSTLISSIAKWLSIDPYLLLSKTFGGSGYDIACAESPGPIFYQINNGASAVSPTRLNWPFKDQLYFVFLEKKQDSREGIKHYRQKKIKNKSGLIQRISEISRDMTHASDLNVFCKLIDEHEELISGAIGIPPVQSSLFSGFKGSIKSLGAWGGDFVLAVSKESPESIQKYFLQLGFSTVLSWNDLILEH